MGLPSVMDSSTFVGLKMRPGAGLCTRPVGRTQWMPSLVNPFVHNPREDARSFFASSCRAELQRQFDGYGDQASYPARSSCSAPQTDLVSADQSADHASHGEAAPAAPFIDFLGVGVV